MVVFFFGGGGGGICLSFSFFQPQLHEVLCLFSALVFVDFFLSFSFCFVSWVSFFFFFLQYLLIFWSFFFVLLGFYFFLCLAFGGCSFSLGADWVFYSFVLFFEPQLQADS